jgi:hypothetical protein
MQSPKIETQVLNQLKPSAPEKKREGKDQGLPKHLNLVLIEL